MSMLLQKINFLRKDDLKNGFWISSRYAVLSLLGFATSVVFARFSEKEFYGSYQYVLSFVALFSIFSIPGIAFASLKNIVRGEFSAVAKGVKMSTFTSLIGSVILVGFAYARLSSGDWELGISLAIAAVFFPFFYGLTPWYVYYEGQRLFRPVAIRSIVSSATIFSILFAGLFFDVSLPILIFLYFGVSSVFLFIFFFEARTKFDTGNDREHISIKHALMVSVQKFLMSFSESFPTILIGATFGYVSVAIFQVAYFPLAALSAYFGALVALMLPDFFSEKKAVNSPRAVMNNFFAGGASLFLMGIFLSFFFIVIYGEEYRDSLRIAWLLVPLVFFYPLKTYLFNYFSAKEKNRFLMILLLIANIFSVTLFFIGYQAHMNFISNVALYMYALNIPLVGVPLYYFLIASKKTDSI